VDRQGTRERNNAHGFVPREGPNQVNSTNRRGKKQRREKRPPCFFGGKIDKKRRRRAETNGFLKRAVNARIRKKHDSMPRRLEVKILN